MTFGEAIRSGFDHYVKFDGRAARPAFWWWVLFLLLVDVAANLIDLAIGVPTSAQLPDWGSCFPTFRSRSAGSTTRTGPVGGS
jgi:uncharacterized membrane protein YhaH (DUF805 family)